jgi:integrase/recombinase XerD
MQLGYELLKGYKRHLFDHGKRAATMNCYESDAKSFIDFLFKLRSNGSLEGLEDLAAFQEQLEVHQSESQNSIRRKIIGVKSFLRFAIPRATCMPSGFDDYPIPARIDGLPDGLDPEDLDSLLNAAQKQVPALKGYRDLAILALLSLEGLKVTEIINLKTSDLVISPSSGSLLIKGAKSRVITLCNETSAALSEYRSFATPFTASNPSLFVGFKGRSAGLTTEGITRHGIKFLLYELGDQCGISRLNSELLRHFAIDYQLKVLGKSTEEVMAHFGLRQAGNIGRHSIASEAPVGIGTDE